MTRTDPTVNAYQSPASSAAAPLPGSEKYVWYALNPSGPLPFSFSWLPAAGIHARYRADRVLLAKNAFHVRGRSGSRLRFGQQQRG
jgi:hypothetical protein